MAYLFKVENQRVIPVTETLLISPFKEIWERDTDSRKGTAILEFTYIEFVSSELKSNPYKGYETDKRKLKIKREIMPQGWEPDNLIQKAIERIEEFQKEASSNYSLYKDALIGKEKLQRFLREFNLDERTRTNALILKPGDVTKTLLEIDKVATSLNSLEKKVEEDLYETVRMRANKEISIFAKPEHMPNR